MIDTFTQTWTYRSSQVTVTYPEGWSGELPPERQLAARKAGVLIPPVLEKADGRPSAPRAPRRARKTKG